MYTPVCRLTKEELDWGVDATRKMRERTRADPFYAVASIIQHGGTYDYSRAQEVVEKMTELPIETRLKLTYRPVMAEFLTETKSQVQKNRIEASAQAVTVWADQCCKDGTFERSRNGMTATSKTKCNLCTTDADLEELSDRVSEVPKIGEKTIDLFNLYSGNEDAVPVDRHVCRYLVNQHDMRPFHVGRKFRQDPEIDEIYGKRASLDICKGRHPEYPLDDKKSRTIRPNEYEKMKRRFQRVSGSCDVSPAKYQMSVWLKGVCHSKMFVWRWSGRGRDKRFVEVPVSDMSKAKVFLQKDEIIDCTRYKPYED